MIPIGLLPMSQGQITPGLLGQGYWLGNQYIAPQYQYAPPQMGLPTATTPPPASVVEGDKAGQPAPDTGAMGGTGAQGQMGGGFAPGVSPGPAPAPSVAGLSPIDPRDLPGLPGVPSEAPSAPQAPAEGLAPGSTMSSQTAVDSKNADQAGETGNKGKADPAAAAAAGLSAYGKELRDTVTSENFMDSMRSMAEKAKADLAATVGGVSQASVDQAMAAEAAAQAQSSEQHGDPAAGGGNTSGGGVSTGQNNDGPDSPGYRKGGRVSSNRNGHLQPVPGILHEGEFVLNPEMTAMMDRHAPGLLTKIARMQKKMIGHVGHLG